MNADQLGYALDGLFTLANAMQREFLRAVSSFDAAEAWREDGVHDMRNWLCFRYGMSVHAARQVIEVAHALEARPAIASAFENGRLSWDKVVDLCAFVPPEDDEHWAEKAQLHNAAQVKEWAKHARRIRREDAARAAKDRSVAMSWDREHDVLRIKATLPGAEGAAFQTALHLGAERFGPDEDGVWAPLEHRLADALIELAGERLASESDADRATVVVHVDADALNRIHGIGVLEDGAIVTSEVVRRLVCDGRITVVDSPKGAPIGIGRTSRAVPTWLLRQLKKRDRGCVVNGCGRKLGLQAHHVIHWAHGGRTDLDNLVLVCRRCHRKIHDEGFRLVRDQYGRVRVLRPDGRPVTPYPIPLRPEFKNRVFGPPRRLEPMRC